MRDPTAYLTYDQVTQMVEAADNLRDRLLVQLLFRTGIRVTEALEIKVKNILWDRRQVIIRALKKRRGGEEVWRPVDIDQDTLNLAKLYLNKRGVKSHYLFDGSNGEHLSRFRAYRIVRNLAEKVGIKKVGVTATYNHPHPHTLRHAFARYYVDKRSPEEGSIAAMKKLQSQLGHSRSDTTMGYIEYSDLEAKKSYDSLWEE